MKKMQQSTVSLLVGLAALLLVIIVLVLIGWLTSKPQKLTIQGTVEAREYRVSGKVAGRVDQLLYQEGDTVSKGQVVVKLDSPELQAKIVQANAQSKAAMAQRAKASGSARSEMVEGAYEMWQKAKVGVDLVNACVGCVNGGLGCHPVFGLGSVLCHVVLAERSFFGGYSGIILGLGFVSLLGGNNFFLE